MSIAASMPPLPQSINSLPARLQSFASLEAWLDRSSRFTPELTVFYFTKNNARGRPVFDLTLRMRQGSVFVGVVLENSILA
jgi:hypothetical protein